MATQTWDLVLVSSLVSVTGEGANSSSAIGTVSVIGALSGSGNNISSGIGTGTPVNIQVWYLTLLDNHVIVAGQGNNISSAGSSVFYGVEYAWWSILASRPVLYHYTHDFPVQTVVQNKGSNVLKIQINVVSTAVRIPLTRTSSKVYIKTRVVEGKNKYSLA